MPQVSWIYKAKDGKDYNVGLYHGDSSRHILLYSQSNVIKIDFSVFTSKSYSFMLGDDLMNLDVIYTNDQPSYELCCDKDIIYPFTDEPTPWPWNDIVKAILAVAVLINIAVIIMSYFLK